MKLFNDETILLSNNDNTVTLTTHRIRSDFGNSSDASLTSMMLENISSIQLNSSSYPILLGLGLLATLVGGILFANSRYGTGNLGGIAVVVGITLVIVYFFSRKHTCIIASDGGSRIVFSTTNMKRAALVEFIDQVEEAKFKRMNVGFRAFSK